MCVSRDEKLAAEVGSFFGTYLGTFTSKHQQVHADIFEEPTGLVAYISFADNLSADQVTDTYFSQLKTFADQQHRDIRLVLSA